MVYIQSVHYAIDILRGSASWNPQIKAACGREMGNHDRTIDGNTWNWSAREVWGCGKCEVAALLWVKRQEAYFAHVEKMKRIAWGLPV